MIHITHHPENTLRWRACIDLTGTLAGRFMNEIEADSFNPGDAIEKCYRDVGARMCLSIDRAQGELELECLECGQPRSEHTSSRACEGFRRKE